MDIQARFYGSVGGTMPLGNSVIGNERWQSAASQSRNYLGQVTAVIVTRRYSPYLAATLQAVQTQTRAPDQILVVDADAPVGASLQLGLQLGYAHFLAIGKVKSFGAAINGALRLAGGAIGNIGWLWLLHDDAAPQPDALANLLKATEHSDAISIAGCKQRRWEVAPSGQPLAPGNIAAPLISVGHTVSRKGQRLTGIDDGEIDQGQHDGRQDVLAVSLAGALIKADLWRKLEGTDPLYGHFGDSTDFCRRARRTGARVVVVPSAVVYHAQASLLDLRHQLRIRSSAPGAAQQIAVSRGQSLPVKPVALTELQNQARASYADRRFAQAAIYLADIPLIRFPFALFWLFAEMPFRVIARLVAKQPAEAGQEFLLPARLVRHIGAIHQARARLARTTRLPGVSLGP